MFSFTFRHIKGNEILIKQIIKVSYHNRTLLIHNVPDYSQRKCRERVLK